MIKLTLFQLFIFSIVLFFVVIFLSNYFFHMFSFKKCIKCGFRFSTKVFTINTWDMKKEYLLEVSTFQQCARCKNKKIIKHKAKGYKKGTKRIVIYP